jgi:hypothetical protein
MTIKPIETVYKGYRFRSRLEARWAVFFDALGVEWEYEKEGFELEDGTRYLPDFWLKKLGCWVEIKPDFVDDQEIHKAGMLAANSKKWVNLISGEPWPGKYSVTAFRHNFPEEKLLKYLQLAVDSNDEWLFHRINMGYCVNDLHNEGCKLHGWRVWDAAHLLAKPYRKHERIISYCEYHKSMSFGYVRYESEKCEVCGSDTPVFYPEYHGYCFDWQNDELCEPCENSDLLANKTITTAFEKARSARFEFGEKGAR